MQPTLAGFIWFLQNILQIPNQVLPAYVSGAIGQFIIGLSTIGGQTVNPVISLAYQVAIDTVNLQLQAAAPNEYTLAVYNLGAHNVIVYANDLPGQNYFAQQRKAFSINSWVPGVVASAADQATSDSLVVSDFMKQLQLTDLSELKTPYGRQYLAFAQKVGTLWGIS